MTRADCLALDADDPLAGLREGVLLPAGMLRLDADQLGPLTREARARLASFMHVEWGVAFSDGRGLVEAATGKLAPLLGAPPEALGFAATAADGLEALVAAAAATGRKRILAVPGAFPGALPRLAAKGLAIRETGAPEALLGNDALLLVGPVDPATGALRDIAAYARQAQEAGALAAFDLSEIVGALPAALEHSGVGAALGRGCGFLCGGPGAPAWVHATGAFAPALAVLPAPSAIALAALDGALDMFAGVDVAALGWKARTLAGLFLAAFGETDPLPPTSRGAHVVLACAEAEILCRALAVDGVHAHLAAPDRITFAFSPLTLSHVDAWDAGTAVNAVKARL